MTIPNSTSRPSGSPEVGEPPPVDLTPTLDGVVAPATAPPHGEVVLKMLPAGGYRWVGGWPDKRGYDAALFDGRLWQEMPKTAAALSLDSKSASGRGEHPEVLNVGG